jgi:hypothetical protein
MAVVVEPPDIEELTDAMDSCEVGTLFELLERQRAFQAAFLNAESGLCM